MAARKRKKSARRGVLSKVRKPIPPPSKVIPDRKKYRRSTEVERIRRAAHAKADQ